MQRLLIILLSVILLITTNKAKSQVYIVKGDSISFEKDSVVILKVPEYRGELYWQQSLNNRDWITSTLKNHDSIIIDLGFDAMYRAKVVDGSCDPFYSDTIKVLFANAAKKIYANLWSEIACHDSTGEKILLKVDQDSLICRKADGKYIFQGDIILYDIKDSIVPKLKGAGIDGPALPYAGNLWPKNTVYYTTDVFFTGNKEIEDAMSELSLSTSLIFKPRTNEPNYVEFIYDGKNENWSRLGMIGRRQELHLQGNVTKGVVIHEIGHTIGLIHEHSRPDQEKHIVINWENIKEGWKDQFYSYPFANYTDSFDFNSIMIYSGYINDLNVVKNPLIPAMTKLKDGTSWLAQRDRLSPGDIEIINQMYPPLKVITLTPKDITSNSISTGGNVISQGGASVIMRGVCWGTSPNPITSDNKTIQGSGSGSFNTNIFGLMPDSTYYIRAYAINNYGIEYGNQHAIKTDPVGNTGTFTDSRDGKNYRWVEIGTQVWMAENLAYVPSVSPPNVVSNTVPHYYINDIKYGALYNWPAAVNASPQGWHLASANDYYLLVNYISVTRGPVSYVYGYGWSPVGKYLKSKSGWAPLKTDDGMIDNNGTDDFGFSALPGGFFGSRMTNDLRFVWKDTAAYFWASNDIPSYYSIIFSYDHLNFNRDARGPWSPGLSVRCVKDQIMINSPSVTTSGSYFVTSSSAELRGEVTDDCGSAVTERGICWSTIPDPTISDNKITSGSGIGEFSITINELIPNSPYYFRAYATNREGTSYGSLLTFDTNK